VDVVERTLRLSLSGCLILTFFFRLIKRTYSNQFILIIGFELVLCANYYFFWFELALVKFLNFILANLPKFND
jgi:hypothetical protein